MIELSLSPRTFSAQVDTELTLQLHNTGIGPCTGVNGTLIPSSGLHFVDGNQRIQRGRLDAGAQHLHRITVQSEQPGWFELRVSGGSYTDERPSVQSLQQSWPLEVLPKPVAPPSVPTEKRQLSVPRRDEIFISYRWDEATNLAGWLAELLRTEFGERRVFQDRDRMQPGLPFPPRIEAALLRATVMVVLIGPRWNPVVGSGRRLDSERDWVRREVSSALAAGIPTIPVFVDGAAKPLADELPENMRDLVTMDYRTIGDLDRKEDITRVVRAVRRRFRVRR